MTVASSALARPRLLAACSLVALGLASSSSSAAVIPGQVVIAEGDTPSGAAAAVTTLRPPYVNGAGQVGFLAFLADGDVAVMRDNAAIWLNSDELVSVLTGGDSPMGISDAGGFAYRPTDDGEQSVWTHNGMLIRETEAAPGFPGGTVTTGHRNVSMTPGGAVYWIAGFNTAGGTVEQGRVLYTSSDGTVANITAVLQTGDTVDTQTILSPNGLDYDYQIADDGSHRIHVVFMDTGDPSTQATVIVDDSVVAQDGSTTGGGDNWASFDLVAVNNDGNYLFSGDTDGSIMTDEFIAYNGAIALREGDTLDSVALTSGSTVRFIALNNFNQAAFAWDDGTVGSEEHLFWACNAADIANTTQRVLTIDDDMIDVDGDTVGDYTVTNVLSGTNAPTNRSGEDYSVFVEVELDGTTEAIIRVPVTCCGNSMDDPLEECDDGNDDNTDDCLDTCLDASCGDGYTWATMEECDDGNDDNTDACLDTCFSASCGDMFVWSGMEDCDDGNDDNTDDCLDTCDAAGCGDGFVWSGMEACDDGNDDDTDDCTSACENAACGDGFVWTNMEDCDDGNDVDDDACANDCTTNDVGTTGTTGGSTSGSTGGVSATDSGGTDSAGTDSAGTDSGGSTSGSTGASGSASASTTAGTSSTTFTTGGSTSDTDGDSDTAGMTLDDDGCGCTVDDERPWRGQLLGLLGLGLLGLLRRRK